MMLPLRKLHLLYRSVQLPLYAMMLSLSLSQHIILHSMSMKYLPAYFN